LDHKDKVEEIAEVSSEILNEWECDFIENMRNKRKFTDRQKIIIDQIYEKACESPYSGPYHM